MKTVLPMLAFALTLSSCVHQRAVPASHTMALDPGDVGAHPPLLAYIPMQRLHETIDGTVQSSRRLDRAHVAGALESIADAMDAFVYHDPAAIETIRANIILLRKPLKPKRQAEVIRHALDAALVALRSHASGRTFDDIERASARIESVSPALPLSQQNTALRYALCAVGNAVAVRAETGRLRCIGSAAEVADNAAWPTAAPPRHGIDMTQNSAWEPDGHGQGPSWQTAGTTP